jgi:hypothetical protein
MAIAISVQRDGVAPVAAAVPLFTMQPNSSWDVSSDGQRFLVNTPMTGATTPPITVVLNWTPRR